jgi:hypothetical protein
MGGRQCVQMSLIGLGGGSIPAHTDPDPLVLSPSADRQATRT